MRKYRKMYRKFHFSLYLILHSINFSMVSNNFLHEKFSKYLIIEIYLVQIAFTLTFNGIRHIFNPRKCRQFHSSVVIKVFSSCNYHNTLKYSNKHLNKSRNYANNYNWMAFNGSFYYISIYMSKTHVSNGLT